MDIPQVKIESYAISVPIGTSNTLNTILNVPTGYKKLKGILFLPETYDSTGTKIGLYDKDGTKVLGDIPIMALKDNIVFNPNSPNTSFVAVNQPIQSQYTVSYILGSTTTTSINKLTVLLWVE